MPYVSLAQARKFHTDPRLKRYAPEWDAVTNFKDLPLRSHKSKRHGAIAKLSRRHR